MKFCMVKLLHIKIFECLHAWLMLITNEGKEINLLVEVANVCLLGILLERKDGACMMWKQMNFLSQEMSFLWKISSLLCIKSVMHKRRLVTMQLKTTW